MQRDDPCTRTRTIHRTGRASSPRIAAPAMARSAAVFALMALAGGAAGAAVPTSSRQAGAGFFEEFKTPAGIDASLFMTSGYWSNGQPFNSGWDPAYWTTIQNTLFFGLAAGTVPAHRE